MTLGLPTHLVDFELFSFQPWSQGFCGPKPPTVTYRKREKIANSKHYVTNRQTVKVVPEGFPVCFPVKLLAVVCL